MHAMTERLLPSIRGMTGYPHLFSVFPGISPFMKGCMTFDDERILHEKTHGCAQWTEHICASSMPSPKVFSYAIHTDSKYTFVKSMISRG